jgi:hypothetical protein
LYTNRRNGGHLKAPLILIKPKVSTPGHRLKAAAP